MLLIVLRNDDVHSGHCTSTKCWSPNELVFLIYTDSLNSWTCFHLGRPRSLSAKDIGIALPKDPFLQVLVHLSKIFSRSADEMYGRRHESLLQMWKIAKSISDDMRCYDSKMQHALGFGLDKPVQQGSLGVRQTILITRMFPDYLVSEM